MLIYQPSNLCQLIQTMHQISHQQFDHLSFFANVVTISLYEVGAFIYLEFI